MKKHLLQSRRCLPSIRPAVQPKPFQDANGKYGIRGLNGQIVEKPIYEWVDNFRLIYKTQWYSIAYLQDKAALIGVDGKPITSFKYSFIRPFSGLDHYTLVNIGGSTNGKSGLTGGKFGLIDNRGREVCGGVLYDDISLNYDQSGKLMSCFLRIGDKQGIANLAFSTTKSSPIRYDELWDFLCNLSIVKTGDEYGCVNSRGRVLLECTYDFINIVVTLFGTFLHTFCGDRTRIFRSSPLGETLTPSTEDEMAGAACSGYATLF